MSEDKDITPPENVPEQLSEPSVNSAAEGPALANIGDDNLIDALQEGSLGDFEAKSQFAACLLPLLQAAGWKGTTRELAEALPHFANNLDLQDMRNVMAQLGFTSLERATRSGDELDHRLLPCLFVTNQDDVYVLHSRDDIHALGFSGENNQYVQVPLGELKGRAFVVQPYETTEADDIEVQENWLMTIVRRFKASIWRLLGLTFVINIISLIGPFYIMTVYDQVIPAESTKVLIGISAGAIVALIIDMLFRVFRSRMISFLGARLEYTLSSAAFGRIMALPASMTESAPLGNQVSRLKDFDSFREMFTSLLFTVVLELPFVVMFLLIIGFLAGALIWIPVIMIGVYGLLWLIMGPALQRAVRNASLTRAERHSFLVETVTRLRTIKENRAEETWKSRYRSISAETAAAHKDTVLHSFMFQTASQTVMTISGLATIAFGVIFVINETMSIGALIATMALIWRVLAPVQNLFMTLARATQIKVAVNQVNALMRMVREDPGIKNNQGFERKWRGALTFQRVSFRYNQIAEPALLGISFTNMPGEMIAITGANGSGKSTILRLILGLYRPQAGQVSLDGMDIRQIPAGELRRAISYLPQSIRLFHGTIAQNLRLANPVSSDAEIRDACDNAGVLEDIEALEDGFETRVGDQNVWHLSAGMLQKLGLARAFLKDTPILLLDEPAQTLDNDGDKALMKTLEKLKGTRTIIMVSHRPSHLRIADRLVVLNQGTVAAMGAPDAVLKEIPEGML